MIRTKTIEIPFQTRITSLATNTTLGTATEHSYDAKDIKIPRNSTPLFACVWVNAADEQTVVTDFDGFRIGIQINAVAFDDLDITATIANTGDHTRVEPVRDVTDYFTLNFPASGECTVEVRVRFQNAAASNVNGVACKLLLTYSFDDEVDGIGEQFEPPGWDHPIGSYTKTVRIGIQSHHTFISTSQVEIGTTGGVNNALANQIPALTGANGVLTDCAELLHWSVEIFASSLGSTTDLLMTIRADGATEIARYNVEQTLGTNITYFDRILYADSSDGVPIDGELDPTTAHAFECKSSVANTFQNIGAIMVLTYIVDPTAEVAYNSVMVPLQNGTSDTGQYATENGEDQAAVWAAILDVQEPGPIVFGQSCAVHIGAHNNSTRSIKVPGQLAARVYTIASSGTRDNHPPLITRGDLPYCSWELMRGRNVLPISSWSSTTVSDNQVQGGFALINYHSGIARNPETSDPAPASHASTCVWPIIPTYDEIASANREEQTPAAPVIEEDYTLFGAFTLTINHANSTTFDVRAQRSITNEIGAGWEQASVAGASGAAELGPEWSVIDTTWWWKRHKVSDPARDFVNWSRLDLETQRDWQVCGSSLMGRASLNYVTHHSITYEFIGTWNHGGSPVDADGDIGKGVNVTSIDEYTNENTLIRRNLPVVAGDFSTTVYDDTCEYAVTTHSTTPAELGGVRGRIERNHGNVECPKIVAVGSYASGAGSDFDITDPQNIFGDYALIFLHSEGTTDPTTPTGWGEAGTSESHQETTGTELDVYDKAATAEGVINNIGDATITGHQNNAGGFMVVIRGAELGTLFTGGAAQSPIDDDDGDIAASGTGVTVPTITTTEDNELVFGAVTHSTDTVATSDQTGGVWANSALARLRAIAGNSSASGNGGGISIFSGMKHTAGATGTETATLANASTQCLYKGSVKGRNYSITDFDIVTGSGGGGDKFPSFGFAVGGVL